MESAQHPSGADQSMVPSQRTSPDSGATVPTQQPVPPTVAAGRTPAVTPVQSPVPPIHPAKTGHPPVVPAQRTGPDPLIGTPPTPASRRWLRPVLAVLGGMLALFCLGGVGIAYVLYDSVTAPDRSAPDVVVSSYLRAYLVERNGAQADLYVCEAPRLDKLRELRAEIEHREAWFEVSVRISWGPLEVSGMDRGKDVRTELTIASYSGGQSRSSRTEHWRFEVVDQDGWRVCGASRVD